MQVFILGAQKIKGWNLFKSSPLLSEKLISGQGFLDWNINSLNQKGINLDSISLISGYKFREIQNLFPKINYIVNPRWKETHVTGSIRHALNYWDGDDLLVFYADTLFKPDILKKFISSASENLIGTSNLISSQDENNLDKINFEKVYVLNNYYSKASYRKPLNLKQFSGLTFLKKDTVGLFKSFLEKQKQKHDYSRFSESLDAFLKVNSKIKFKSFDISDSWVELDSLKNISKFIFGSKAETLNRIEPYIKKSVICDQIYFDISEWNSSQKSVIKKIQNKFNKNIIIRSSSLEEDSWENSQAGLFLSIKDVDPTDNKKLIIKINEVIGCYTKNNIEPNMNNQVLIQPYINNAKISGVVFSKTLEEGAPYYCISYDDNSSETDTVTSGSSNQIKTYTIQRNFNKNFLNPIINKILQSVEELELILNYSSLDVEFIIDDDENLYIVQIRPITSHKSLIKNVDFDFNFNKVKSSLNFRLKNKSHLYGDINLLSDMTDWNPAEMIGTNPKPLSLSLYQYLVTDSTWRISRGMIGYNNPSPEKLLFCLGGHPYIDVRNSLNNLIPTDLSSDLSNKLLNHYLCLVKKKKHLHDKIEFDVAITCYSPDIDNHLLRLKKDDFSSSEIIELKTSLKNLTNDIITEKKHQIDDLINKTIILENKSKQIIEKGYDKNDIPRLIQLLLDECVEHGTIPFSILARYGFIGSSMINGLVNKKIINENQKNQFLNSIETVATEMLNEMNLVIENKRTLSDFLNKYGHLRPNSYNIESFSYNEKPEYYLPSNKNKIKINSKIKYNFDSEVEVKISDELKEMDFDSSQLLIFIKKAISAREYSKFQFTKVLSLVLDLMIEYGNHHGLNRSEMSFISIQDIINIDSKSLYLNPKIYMDKLVEEGKNWYDNSNEIKTPGFVSSINGFDVIEKDENLPNYVSMKSVDGEVFYLNSIGDNKNITGKIILIEGADPGYDWIFLYNIKGLITKYGGAASHMTIRCAEFGLPAAIGCGESLFNELKKSNLINLDCASKKITKLN